LGNYTTCSYFPIDEKVAKEIDKEVSYYPAVNLLDGPIESGCEFFYLIRTSKGLVARCDIQGRVITKSQALLCSKLYNKCPFRLLFKS